MIITAYSPRRHWLELPYWAAYQMFSGTFIFAGYYATQDDAANAPLVINNRKPK